MHFPKTIYLRNAVLLDDSFRCYIPFFCKAAGDLDEALSQVAVKHNSLLHII